MKPRRKTLDLDAVVKHANRVIWGYTMQGITAELTWSEADAARRAVCSTLEAILHDHDAYRGFRYLPTEFSADTGALRENYDDLARAYF